MMSKSQIENIVSQMATWRETLRVTYAINARLAGGGIGNTAYNAVRALAQRGWLQRLVVSSCKTNEFRGADVRDLGLVGRALKRVANYDASQRLNVWGDALFDVWAAQQIPECDIFHGWNNHARVSLHSAKKRGAKTIVERGGSHILQGDELLRAEFARLGWREQGIRAEVIARSLDEFETTDYIMVPSQYNVDSFVARGVARERLLLLPLGVDTARFCPAPRLLDEQPPTFRVLFVGQVSLRKGIQYVLQAWRAAGLANAELVIAGDIKRDAAPVIAPYQNDKMIRWLGHISDPVALYQSADVFVFPSIEEGSALVTYEAMACGLPSIVTPNAGALVRDQLDGFVVPLRDVDAIAEKLSWLAAHREERARMGRNARMFIEPMTWEHYGERLLEFYEQIVAAPQ